MRTSRQHLTSLLTVTALALTWAEGTRADPAPDPRRAAYEVAVKHQALGAFDEAASVYEAYAADRAAPDADRALAEAAALRLGLGSDDDVRKAFEDLATFQRTYRGSKTPHAASIALSLATHHAAREAWDEAIAVLREALPSIDTVAGLDLRVQAHALLGRAHLRRNRTVEALAEYGRVREMWGDPKAASQRLRDAYPNEDEAQMRLRLDRAVDAVGEALFALADASRKATVDALVFPAYTGSNERDDIHKHIKTKVAAWRTKRTEATVRVQGEYARIFELKPAPPRWVTAASAQSALLWGRFVAEFRGAPIPKAWKKPGCALHCGTSSELTWEEIRGDYYALLDEAAEPIKRDRAKPAFVACLKRATSLRHFDDATRACERWRGKNDRAEFVLLDELRGEPTLEGRATAEAAPLGWDGR